MAVHDPEQDRAIDELNDEMVAAGVGTTLLPDLSVRPPVPEYDGVVLRRFRDPAPSRRIAMFWRATSSFDGFLPLVADVLRSAIDEPLHRSAV